MRIALIGPPGTGKSSLADQLENVTHGNVVDGYLEALKHTHDFALGPWSTYVEEFMVAGYRHAHEQNAGEDVITVGTILDTITYSVFRGEVVTGRDREDFQREYTRIQSAMSGLALIYAETWAYDYAFYLPYSNPDPQREPWKDNLDIIYRSVIEQFDPPNLFILDDKSIDEVQRIIGEPTPFEG